MTRLVTLSNNVINNTIIQTVSFTTGEVISEKPHLIKAKNSFKAKVFKAFGSASEVSGVLFNKIDLGELTDGLDIDVSNITPTTAEITDINKLQSALGEDYNPKQLCLDNNPFPETDDETINKFYLVMRLLGITNLKPTEVILNITDNTLSIEARPDCVYYTGSFEAKI